MESRFESSSLLDQLKELQLTIQRFRRHVEQQAQPHRTTKPPVKHAARVRKVRKPSAADVSTLLHLPEALQENILEFTQSLDLSADSELLDELYQEHCINEDDYRAIRHRVASDQVRYLVVKIKCRPPTVIQKFLDILKDRNYEHIVNKINESRNKLIQDKPKTISCVICVMKTMVDIKDIADYMWKDKILESDMYHNLVVSENPQQYRRQFWEHVSAAIDSQRVNVTWLANVMDEAGYDHIGTYIKQLPRDSKLECCCICRRQPKPNPNRDSVSSTQSEFSTTSEVPRSNRESFFSDVDDGVQYRKQNRHKQIKDTNELLQKKTLSDIIKEVENEFENEDTQSYDAPEKSDVTELFQSSTETVRPTSGSTGDGNDNDETFVKCNSSESTANVPAFREVELSTNDLDRIHATDRGRIMATAEHERVHVSMVSCQGDTEPKMVYRHQSTGYTPSDELDQRFPGHTGQADGFDYPDTSVQMRHVSGTSQNHKLHGANVRQKIHDFERKRSTETKQVNDTCTHVTGKKEEPRLLPQHLSAAKHYPNQSYNTQKRWKSETILTLKENHPKENPISVQIPRCDTQPPTHVAGVTLVENLAHRRDTAPAVNHTDVNTQTRGRTSMERWTENERL